MANPTVSEQKGVSFIVNGNKAYPPWIKSHTVFKNLNKIEKIFPRIGLPNFKEEVQIASSEAMSDAVRLVNKISHEMQIGVSNLYTKLDESLKIKGETRGKICASIQETINLFNNVLYSFRFADYTSTVDGRVVLKLRSDCFSSSPQPIFREGEALLRVVGKLWDMAEKNGVSLAKVDSMQEFKIFSKNNIPNKKFNLVFSSNGEEGAWDIATISMRGVSSCQTWTQPQSRGLIGSISSKFVGVIYLESDTDIPGYGKKMLNRALVRFCVSKQNKQPALILDTIYPSATAEVSKLFKKVLTEKSGLPVLLAAERGTIIDGVRYEVSNYYIPDEPSRKYLNQGEFSYMDFQIPVMTHSSQIKKSQKDLSKPISEFKEKIGKDIDAMLKMKRELFESTANKYRLDKEAFEVAKTKFFEEHGNKPENERPKFEMPEPTMDADFAAFGGLRMMMLHKHCDKKYGANKAGSTFANLILNAVECPKDAETEKEYYRKFLINFIKNGKDIKSAAWAEVSKGSWMKTYPKISEVFFHQIFKEIKNYCLAEVRKLING